MRISTKSGIFNDWYDYEIILPGKFLIFRDSLGYEGFNIPVKAGGVYNYALRIVDRSLLFVKYMDKVYDMRNPKEYLLVKNIIETEIAVASLT